MSSSICWSHRLYAAQGEGAQFSAWSFHRLLRWILKSWPSGAIDLWSKSHFCSNLVHKKNGFYPTIVTYLLIAVGRNWNLGVFLITALLCTKQLCSLMSCHVWMFAIGKVFSFEEFQNSWVFLRCKFTFLFIRKNSMSNLQHNSPSMIQFLCSFMSKMNVKNV